MIMKKLIIFTASALVAMCACTKTEVNTLEREVTFQTVNYVGQTKALEGSAFTYDHFGTYAWSEGTQGLYFMDNETITLQAGEWKPSTTYYWPKKSNVDFISYYPRVEKGDYLTIEEEKISYKDFNVAENQIDLLYADKVVDFGYADNKDGSGVVDGENNYKTVPAFFHHALAQVNVIAKLAYRAKTVTEANGSITNYKWDVEITGAKLSNINTTGSLDLTLSADENEDLAKTFPWEKPATEIWTPTADVANKTLTPGELSVDGTTLLSGYYVLPQDIKDQTVDLTFTIKTYRGINGAEPTEFLTEKDVPAQAKLVLATNVETWKINQATTYVIILTPTAGSGKDPDDPDKPIDPDDPDLKDVELTFDPAVTGWDPEVAAVAIYL